MSQVILITGGSRGIGAALARQAAARGYAVCLSYASKRAAADAVVAEIRAAGGQARAVLWLLSDEASYTTGTVLDVAGGR